MNHEKFFAVMGTMGSGKSTVTEFLATKLKLHSIPEIINPVLDKFYENPQKYAFLSQVSCLTTKYVQTDKVASVLPLEYIMQDTPIHQDRIYAIAQHILGNMNDDEMALYERLFGTFMNRLKKLPNHIIYLKADLPVILQRIAERDRACERKIPPSYVELLDNLNNKWLADNHTIPVLLVETDGLDIVHSPVAQKQLVDQVREIL